MYMVDWWLIQIFAGV